MNSRLLRLVLGSLLLASFCTMSAPALTAQQTRAEIIQQALSEFDEDRALVLLQSGIDPTLPGPLDSLWALGVMSLVEIVQRQDPALATTWLRWAVRVRPEIQVDTLAFLELMPAYNDARSFVLPTVQGDSLAETDWRWGVPAPDVRRGMLELTASEPAGLQVEIEGVDTISVGDAVFLETNSYNLIASADGYLPANVTREVLPGVTTVVGFNLTPEPVAVAEVVPDSVLLPEAEGRLARGLLGVVPLGDGVGDCRLGFVATSDGLVATTYGAIRGAERVELWFSGDRQVGEGTEVAAYDVSRDLAVLKVPPAWVEDSLHVVEAAANQYSWVVGLTDCRPGDISRIRLGMLPEAPDTLLTVAGDFTAAEQRGLLVDQAGGVLAIVQGPNTGFPATRLSGLLAQARSRVAGSSLYTLRAVAERERHRIGYITLTSDLIGASARVTPLEEWQWPQSERTDTLPMVFVGPQGRYGVELLSGGEVVGRSEITVQPDALGEATHLAHDVPAQIAAVPEARGGFPWPIAAVGLLGGAAGAVLLLLNGDDGPNGNGNGEPTTGGIIIRWPP
ncbi:MAG: hypothetical protein JSW71_14005 [Gemmatimonadota bacterium]|nr:MAG: hypothetical protein JSW71_14005 [Gemmatimonadota bacterium]